MLVAALRSLVGVGLLIVLGVLWTALAPWAWPVFVPVVVWVVYGFLYALPVLFLGSGMRSLKLGTTVVRSFGKLTDDQEWELFRLPDLVKGRLWDATPGAECDACEIWVVPTAIQATRVRRARAIGIGVIGPAICAVTHADLSDSDACIAAIADGVAGCAEGGLNGRIPIFVRWGLRAYLLVCGRHAEGPDRSLPLHAEAKDAVGSFPGLTACFRRLTERSMSKLDKAFARSFVAFLIGRYGWRAFLSLLRHADSYAFDLALFKVYGRNLPDLERRWLVFLEGSQDDRSDTTEDRG